MKLRIALYFTFAVFSLQAISEPWCTTKSGVGSKCKILIEKLVPTQFAVGQDEVTQRQKKLTGLSEEEIKELTKNERVSIVVSPDGKFYLLDGHHIASVLLVTPLKDIKAEVEGNYSFGSRQKFWSLMKQRGWVHLYDENGVGPLVPEMLPAAITELRDDPYRMLAGEVRRRGGFDRTPVYYAEFQWANFFRPRIKRWDSPEGFNEAIEQALLLSRTKEAGKLPGWKGKP